MSRRGRPPGTYKPDAKTVALNVRILPEQDRHIAAVARGRGLTKAAATRFLLDTGLRVLRGGRMR